MQIGWKETPLKSDCPPSSRPSSQRVFRLVGKNIRSNESSFARASSGATFIYFLFVGLTSCDFRPWQLWKITWMQNTYGWKKRVKKSDSSQSLRTLSLVAKPTAQKSIPSSLTTLSIKSYQSKRLLWRWAFRHSDAQPGHETRWRRSHFSRCPLYQNLFECSMAECFFEHFHVSSFNILLYVTMCISMQCRLLPCIFIFSHVWSWHQSQEVCSWLLKVSPIWDQHRQSHSAPREPESKHSIVELSSDCNICHGTRLYNCRAVASDELIGWESYSLS